MKKLSKQEKLVEFFFKAFYSLQEERTEWDKRTPLIYPKFSIVLSQYKSLSAQLGTVRKETRTELNKTRDEILRIQKLQLLRYVINNFLEWLQGKNTLKDLHATESSLISDLSTLQGKTHHSFLTVYRSLKQKDRIVMTARRIYDLFGGKNALDKFPKFSEAEYNTFNTHSSLDPSWLEYLNPVTIYETHYGYFNFLLTEEIYAGRMGFQMIYCISNDNASQFDNHSHWGGFGDKIVPIGNTREEYLSTMYEMRVERFLALKNWIKKSGVKEDPFRKIKNLTYDPNVLSPDQIKGLPPAEFNEYKEGLFYPLRH